LVGRPLAGSGCDRQPARSTWRVRLEASLFLLVADVGDDGVDLGVAEAGHRWHVAEVPVVRPCALGDGCAERSVRVVARFVDLREVGRPQIRAPKVRTVTRRARLLVQRCTVGSGTKRLSSAEPKPVPPFASMMPITWKGCPAILIV
jgi:hypothetical protein